MLSNLFNFKPSGSIKIGFQNLSEAEYKKTKVFKCVKKCKANHPASWERNDCVELCTDAASVNELSLH